MKPPRRARVDVSAVEEPLALSSSADAIGRLVALLRGEGLTKSTVQELLRPETAAKLRGILTEHVFLRPEDYNPGPASQHDRLQSEDGKLLVFKAREANKT